MMKSLTKNEAARFLQAHDHFAIVTHRRPDGDTLGSAGTLCLGLRQLGKTVHVLENPEVTEKYQYLCQGLCKAAPEDGDTIVSVDVSAPSMLGEAFQYLKDQIVLRIDHHGASTSFTPMELVEADAAACGEIIYDLLMELGVSLDVPMANALYTAISTDTGCFRFANTTSHTFRVAAACAEVSKELFRFNQALFETNSLARLRLQGWIVENALFLQNGQVVICPLTKETERQLGLQEDDMENISGFPRTIAGVKLTATLREEPDGTIKVSVRSVPGYDASAVAVKFGGGGHKGAAGGIIALPMEEAIKVVTEAMPEV